METHAYLDAVLGICTILLIGSILYLFSNRFKSIPYSVLLLAFGMIISPLNLEIFEIIRLTPGSVMFIFLPILLFESAFNFDYREFRKILAPGFLLASVGLLLSAFVVALPLYYFFNIPFLDAYLYGSVISSTDPIAVLTIFKRLGVPKKLQLLVDGESFLNDATSVIMFRIISALTVGASATFGTEQVVDGSINFVIVLVGGLLIGCILGWLFSEIISRIKNISAVEITLTIIFAHLAFIIAEDIFHVSGILAVLSGGLVLGNYGRTKISPKVSHNMHQMWDMLVFLSSSIVFLLIGYEIKLDSLTSNLPLVIGGTVALLIGRALSTYVMTPGYNLFTNAKNRIPLSWMHIVNWGGLRGVLPLIVVLSLPESYEYREPFIQLVLGAILFTLIINALTIKPLIQFLKLDKLAVANEIEIKVTEAFVLKEVLDHLEKLHKLEEIRDEVYKANKKKTEEKLEEVKSQLSNWAQSKGQNAYSDEMEKVLRRYCLHIEKAVYSRYFRRGIITESLYRKIKDGILQQIENIDFDKAQFNSIESNHKMLGRKGSVNLKPNFIDSIRAKLGLVEDLEVLTLKNYYSFHKLRLLGNEKVLEELEEYQKAGIFSQQVFTRIFDFYKDLYFHNRSILQEIEKRNPKETKQVEENLFTNECSFMIEHVLEEFGEDSRISAKALQNIELKL